MDPDGLSHRASSAPSHAVGQADSQLLVQQVDITRGIGQHERIGLSEIMDHSVGQTGYVPDTRRRAVRAEPDSEIEIVAAA